ncbi:lantibiotic dehydratase [Streptosporangium sp. NPDC000239]|uniref:lantibiotic dehydratase n=1 Tax=Streptosporangium sp. NPDC000239 TaxID=3154248 RepID=UPI0033226172
MTGAEEEPAWRPAEFFVLRTPYLPLDALFALGGDGLVETDFSHERATAEHARALDRLRALCLRPDVREALWVASPSLEGRLDGWARDPRGGFRIGHGLLRYVARMAGRPTPFGLFAGCSLGTVGEETRLRLASREAYRRHTSLDARYLAALAESLQRDPALRPRLRYLPNSSVYRAAGRLRYTETRPAGAGTSYHLVAVEPTAHLEAVLERAAGGALPGELACAVGAVDPEVGRDEALDFVDRLIDAQLLVCELGPTVSGPEPVDDLLDRLDRAGGERARPVVSALRRARTMLAGLDESPPGADPEHYREVAAALPALAEVPVSFHVDLTKPAGTTLGRDVLAEIERGVRLLRRVGAGRRGDPLARFREAFLNRYDRREVPLCEALDDEIGVGFPADGPFGAAPAPLLDDLAFPAPPRAEDTRLSRRDALVTRWLAEAACAGVAELSLGEAEVRALEEAGEAASPPDSFGVVATIIAADEDEVAAGRYRIMLSAVGGLSGTTLMGRFCRRDDRLLRHLQRHLRAEEALRPEAVYAEIVHPVPGKVGNVLVRPRLREYEIVYLGRPAAPERRMPLDDLTVSVTGERVVLRSRSLGREVLPRLTVAHRFDGAGSPALYRFLCHLQRQGKAGGLSFSFGGLDDAPYLPRVTAGRLVLSRARWRLSDAQLASLEGPTAAARFAAVQDLRRLLRLPRWVAVVDADRRLPIDLDNPLFADMAVHLFREHRPVRLEEVFFGPDEVPATGPEGRFAHEIIVPFLRTSAPEPTAGTPARQERPLTRSFPPGSPWLYAKLYSGPVGADTILQQVVRPLVRAAVSDASVDRWFFVRYADPDPHLRLRLHGDPGRLMNEVLPALLAACAPFHAEGTLWRIQLDTYEREVERYGGADGIVLAERLFHADSDAALKVIGETPRDMDARWRLALVGLDRLLDDLGLDLAGRLSVSTAARDRFRREFGADTAFAHRLGARYRRERTRLESLLAAPDHLYRARSEALRPIAGDLAACAGAGRLTRHATALVGSFLHMHANRMLPAAARAQELVLYDFLSRWYRSRVARTLIEAATEAPRRATGRSHRIQR